MNDMEMKVKGLEEVLERTVEKVNQELVYEILELRIRIRAFSELFKLFTESRTFENNRLYNLPDHGFTEDEIWNASVAQLNCAEYDKNFTEVANTMFVPLTGIEYDQFSREIPAELM